MREGEKASLILHGGFWEQETDDPRIQEHRTQQKTSLEIIGRQGWKFLNARMNAVDVVEQTVRLLEEDPVFNAGKGAAIGREGQIELDASIMDGTRDETGSLRYGSVAVVRNSLHPISVARKIMDEYGQKFLVGEGALAFAQQKGLPEIPADELQTSYQEYMFEKWNDSQTKPSGSGTVGVVARDVYGNIAAGTSTGGMTGKEDGRVGDSPIIGAGTYADSKYGGASATGTGEKIIIARLAGRAVDYIETFVLATPKKAVERAIDALEATNGRGGLILIDRYGNIAYNHNGFGMPVAFMTETMKAPRVVS